MYGKILKFLQTVALVAHAISLKFRFRFRVFVFAVMFRLELFVFRRQCLAFESTVEQTELTYIL